MSNPDPPEALTTGCQEWPVTWPCSLDGIDEDKQAIAYNAAVQLLHAYAGRAVGVCVYDEGYWPRERGCVGPWGPFKGLDGQWRNASGHDCCRVLLAQQPAVAVINVTEFGGDSLDAGSYVLDGPYLRRRGACWSTITPCEDPPLRVVYSAGFPLPSFTGAAVGEVACEILYALDGSPCKISNRAVTVTRQGVTVQLASADELAKRLRLGLPIADAWLEVVNPNSLRARSQVYSPDLAQHGH